MAARRAPCEGRPCGAPGGCGALLAVPCCNVPCQAGGAAATFAAVAATVVAPRYALDMRMYRCRMYQG